MATEMMKVEVRATTFETRSGIKAKKGDVIEVPANTKDQSQQIKWGLRSGNLKPVRAVMDTAPAAPSQKLQEELKSLREENETLKKTNAGLKGALTKAKKEPE